MDEVDFTILAAKSVLSDMMDKCPPAETCRDAFDRTAKAAIKMASSTGGFGAPTSHSRRHRRDPPAWNTTPESSKGSTQARHRHQSSDQASYPFDLALSDSLSSPTLSVAGDLAQPSPPGHRTSDGYMMPRVRGGPSPSEMGMKQEGSPVESSLVPTPPSVPRRVTSQPSTTPGGSYGGQQYSGPGSVEYPDAQTMEFLQNLGAAPNGEFPANMDQSQVDLGFGMNWEGMHHDFSDGQQQMNPFDSFFFGGPQGGNGNGANNGGGMGL